MYSYYCEKCFCKITSDNGIETNHQDWCPNNPVEKMKKMFGIKDDFTVETLKDLENNTE